MSLHIKTITSKLRKKPKNPIKNKQHAVKVYPQGGMYSKDIESVASKYCATFWLLTKFKSVTEIVFIIMTNNKRSFKEYGFTPFS